MLTVTIWNQITTEFFGRSVSGSYVIGDRTLTVKARRGEKSSTYVERSDPIWLAERLLRELAADGKA
jgi:hypothetical protein